VAAGAVLLTRLEPTTSVGYLFTAYVLFGIGFGVVNAPITNSAVSGMPRSQAGVAAGVASTSRQIGQTLGVAVAGAIAGASAGAGAGGRAFALATHPAWWVVVGCAVVISVLGLVTTGSWALGTARRTAEQISGADQREPVAVS
jgi:Na+/melibiose symporter-like transporter